MIKSILSLMWKRKKNSFLMIVEIFISFLLLFALSAMTINNIKLYNQPLGFSYEDIWVVDISFNRMQENAEPAQEMELLKRNIRAIQEVQEVSNCSYNIPYSQSTHSSRFKYNGNEINTQVNIMRTDFMFHKVFNMQIAEGKWYNATDIGQNETPIVINKELRKEFIDGEAVAIGKVIYDKERKYKIVGVVENYKLKGELSEAEPVMFRVLKPNEIRERILIKAMPDNEMLFEQNLTNIASSTVKNWTIQVNKLSEQRKLIFKQNWMPIIIFSSICTFLILNIILGLFGTLLYNINNRRPEIGLRRSVGAPTAKIYQQFIGEMLMITTMGIIPAIIVAIQVPILKIFEINTIVFMLAIICATSIVYVLVLVSSFIPSRLAAKIQPAIALHEE